MSANISAESQDQQPKIQSPRQVLAARISALEETSVRYALYSLAYSADPADRASLDKALNEAEQWQRELAAVRAYRLGDDHGRRQHDDGPAAS
jgi:hypothetical protein